MRKFLKKWKDFDRQATDKECDHGPSCPVLSLAGLVDQENTYGVEQKLGDDKSIRRPDINVAEYSDSGPDDSDATNQLKHLHRESHLGWPFEHFFFCHKNLPLNEICVQQAMV